MRFELLLRASNKDGKQNTDTNGIHISGASEIILYLTAATSFNGYDKCPDKQGKDEDQLARSFLAKALQTNYEPILKKHLADFQKYFNRVSLVFGEN